MRIIPKKTEEWGGITGFFCMALLILLLSIPLSAHWQYNDGIYMVILAVIILCSIAFYILFFVGDDE